MLNKLIAESKDRLSPGLRKILGNVGWLFIEKLLRVVLDPIIWIWVARYLGPEQLGTYSYALSFVALFEVLSGLGLRGIVVRDIVSDPNCKDEILGTMFFMKVVGGLCCFIVTTTVISLTQPNDSLIYWLVATFALSKVFQSFSNIGLWFEAQVQSKFSTYTTSLAFIIGAISKIVLILVGAPLIAFAWLVVLQTVVEAIGFIVTYHITGQRLQTWQINLSKARELLSQSWPLILAGIGTVLYLKIDQVMLGAMVDVREVGIYAAAVRFSEASYFIPTIITASVFPALIKSRISDQELYTERLQKLYNWMTAIALTIAVSGAIFANYIVAIMYGKEYQEAGTILAIHIWASIFIFWHQINMDWLVNEGLLKFPLVRQGVGAIVNIALNWILIPTYGGTGAAIATLISYGIASYLIFFLTPKTRVAATMMTLSLVAPFQLLRKK